MKSIYLIPIIAGVLLAGCGDNSSKSGSSGNSSGGSVLTAPADYLNDAAKAQQKAVKTVDTTALTSAIQLFNVQEGRFPKDLNELVEKKYIARIPETPHGSKIVYDASTGTVKVVNQ